MKNMPIENTAHSEKTSKIPAHTTKRSASERSKSSALTLRRMTLALFLVTALAAASSYAETKTQDVRIAFLGEKGGDAWAGAEQGIAEANAQGKFLGLRYVLLQAEDADSVRGLSPSAVIAATSALRMSRLATDVAPIPVLNTTAEDDELRQACEANAFHVIPSFAMREDALFQWRRKSPDGGVRALAWHPLFKKYAAAQLNKRYTETTGRQMNDVSWAGWAAVRIVAESIARGGTSLPEAVGEHMRTELAFDGQKGTDMSFRETGQLRQPLLLVKDTEIVGEAPVRGVVDPSNLDSLGLPGCLK